MTTRQIIILGFLIFSLDFSGQTFNSNYFLKTSWFCNDKDSSFFKSDTVRFIKYKNTGPIGYTNEKAENESRYFNHGDRVELNFQKPKKLGLTSIRQNSIGSVTSGWIWTINNKTNLLTISNTTFLFIFRPVSQRQIKLTSRFALQPDSLVTTELILIRIK